MMDNYFLITYYNRGSMDSPIWEVYGVYGRFSNDILGTFDDELGAQKFAHGYGIPVIRGTTNSYVASIWIDLWVQAQKNEKAAL